MPNTLFIEYPETIPISSNLSLKDFELEARKAMAVKLYEIGRITSGQAGQIAGITRVEFLLACIEMGTTSVEWDDDEIVKGFNEKL